MGVYTLVRLIDFKPDNLIFKNTVKQNIVSTINRRVSNYMYHVKKVLDYSEDEIIEEIQPLIDKHLMLPLGISGKIRDFSMEIDVNV